MASHLLACLLGAASLAAPPAHETLGCWAVWPANRPAPRRLLNSPQVQGLACRVTWEHLAPGPNELNTAFLDDVFQAAERAGKKISLNVIPGATTPAWVYGEGAKQFPPTGMAECPVPWDAVYTDRWHRLIRALGARYADRPSLTHVKLTGVNHNSGEMALPHSAADTRAWVSLGYSHDRIVEAFAAHSAAWAEAFPRQELVLPIQTSGLPKSDNRNPVLSIVAAARPRWPDRFVLANHALSTTFVNPHVAEHARQGGKAGFQHLAPVTGESRFRMNGGVPGNEKEIFDKAVRSGISAGGRYQEVYQGDALNPQMQETLKLLNRRP